MSVLAQPRVLGAAAIVVVLIALGTAVAQVTVRQERSLRLDITPLVSEAGATRALESLTVEATRDEPGVLETALAWSQAGPPAMLTLEVAVDDGAGEDRHALRLTATVRIRGEAAVRSSREMTLAEGTSGLFDVLEQGSRRLVLSIRAEESVRTVVGGRRRVGAPVLFQVAIERRDGGRAVPLESNRLVTFLGEGVEYSFSHGEGNSRESLRLVLTPVRLDGDIAEVEVDVTGSLPGGDGPLLLSRRERILTSRRATSSLEVTAGDPPAGYRFRITPDF